MRVKDLQFAEVYYKILVASGSILQKTTYSSTAFFITSLSLGNNEALWIHNRPCVRLYKRVCVSYLENRAPGYDDFLTDVEDSCLKQRTFLMRIFFITITRLKFSEF